MTAHQIRLDEKHLRESPPTPFLSPATRTSPSPGFLDSRCLTRDCSPFSSVYLPSPLIPACNTAASDPPSDKILPVPVFRLFRLCTSQVRWLIMHSEDYMDVTNVRRKEGGRRSQQLYRVNAAWYRKVATEKRRILSTQLSILRQIYHFPRWTRE
ncbi:hypothetical protein B0T26DRAFT_701622 [Lasiosphaeria miniovina]|uniref:Uncharacterized protein n=1 Tax=Lasiosphaeria miniovina TaxID=1954250 RepID=A0AA40AUC1_9PEZI|nr:uncharacterized protein B0T26DRAFT_701622 [Lasiosphaeria miniovina]KAK0722170.1 hypothetical protein B0T26DRAFT_701622 [Lasiosphaeria miniovina]